MQLTSIGLGSYVNTDRVIAIVSPDSSPIKRLVQDAKDSNTVIDSTYGRRTRSVLIMDSGQIVLSSLQPETILTRSNPAKDKENN